MRDIGLVIFLASLLSLGLRKPFLFVLAYTYIDIVAPQQLSYFLLNSVPVSLIAFMLAFLSWLAFDDKRNARLAPRQALMVVLLIYCYFTTQSADFPLDAADKWGWVWKALVFAIFLPMTLRTKLRIEALALFMVLCAGSIIITGGIKTVLSGGGYGVLNLMVTNNTGLYESSTIACVAVAIIPIILYLMKNGTIFPPEWRVQTFAIALCGACLLIPVGTEARTGLVCIAVLGVLALRHVRRPILYIMGAATLGLVSVPFLPDSFTKRMDTINEYEADASASTRVMVWQWTMDYVELHPWGGGFEAYRGNVLRYEAVKRVDTGGVVENQRTLVEDKGRAYHSAYFEMLGEQGWLGLAIWLMIQIAGLFRMEAIYRRYQKRKADDGQWIGLLAGALQQTHIIYLIGALFVGIAFQPFILMLIGTQIGLDSYARRRERVLAWKPVVNILSKKEALAAAQAAQ